MTAITILLETADTVTISRSDWLRMLTDLEDAQDRAAVAERRVYERRIGTASARTDYLTAEEALRLLDGGSPVRVWREKRGLSQRALAAEAGIAGSYLAEIETGRKPGSDGAYRRISAILCVPVEDLKTRRNRRRGSNDGPVALCLGSASPGISAGGRGARVERLPYPTVDDALEFVRANWKSLRSRSPALVDQQGAVIYTTEELIREVEAGL